MLHRLQVEHPGAVQGLLTTTNDAFNRVAMHGVPRAVLEAQATAAQLPLHVVPLPWPCSNEEYERRMGAAVTGVVAQGFTHVAFGDLFLEDVRAYRERQLAGTGFTPLFPVWGEKTAALARRFIADGFRATIVCVDTQQLDGAFAGRAFDEALLDELPGSADPCGENGEFHTFVADGPIFSFPIRCATGEHVLRDDRFAYCDLLLEPPTTLRAVVP